MSQVSDVIYFYFAKDYVSNKMFTDIASFSWLSEAAAEVHSGCCEELVGCSNAKLHSGDLLTLCELFLGLQLPSTFALESFHQDL